jgi:hypothetical protein
MYRKIFTFVRARLFDVAGLLMFIIYFALDVRSHSVTAAYGHLAAICAFISGLLGPNISVRLTLPEIFQEIRKAGIPRYNTVRRICQYLCFGLLGLCIYSAFTRP